eukprot:TRINITY_DN6361_c0_g1_i2.p1 TRINITY_DN6361_c0_g1~~TRINITY_DN6361_c0_g1_i2.p1  ORF type:complete len:644 (-),score=74.97 TRINITY_DN6361_c0_g1_i2:587-2518(-)
MSAEADTRATTAENLRYVQTPCSSLDSSCSWQLPFAQRLLQLFNAAEAKQLLRLSSQQSGMHVDASRWCITREDLCSFAAEVRAAWEAGEIPEDPEHPNLYHNDPSIGPNIYAVNEHFIKPRTMEAGVSWALMKHPEGLPCDAFVTHSWHEGIFEFAEKVQGLWPSDARHLYCCFLSNPQNGDVSAMLGQSAVKSPFAVALARARYLLVVPNHQQSIYSRLWCVFEAHVAMQLGLQILLPSKPRVKDMLLALVPRVVFAFAAGVLQFLYLKQPHVELAELTVVRLTGAVIVFCSPWLSQLCDSRYGFFGALATWVPFLLLGLQMGIAAFVFVYIQAESTVYYGAIRVLCMVLLFVTLIEESMRVLAARVVANESGLLHFDSIRHAMCSCPNDEKSIREALAGDEDLLDSAIRTLRAVGSYSRRVHEALWLGVPAGRLRHGTGYAVILLAAFAASIALFYPFCSSGWIRMTSPGLVVALLLLVSFAIVFFVVRLCPEPRVLATDSLLMLATSTSLSISATNHFYIGRFAATVMNNAEICKHVPWYIYAMSTGTCFCLWFVGLRFLYGTGLRAVMKKVRPDGLLVAGNYCCYDRRGAQVNASQQESIGRVLSYVSGESRRSREAKPDEENESAEATPLESTVASL